jgi:hypothetical protein
MERWNWVVVRAYGPAAFALLVAVASVVVLSQWQASPLLAGFVVVGRWVPLLALVATVALVVAPTYRLWKWERGDSVGCPRCDGPLGHERIGQARMGGAYRRCYACGKNANHRHYSN